MDPGAKERNWKLVIDKDEQRPHLGCSVLLTSTISSPNNSNNGSNNNCKSLLRAAYVTHCDKGLCLIDNLSQALVLFQSTYS